MKALFFAAGLGLVSPAFVFGKEPAGQGSAAVAERPAGGAEGAYRPEVKVTPLLKTTKDGSGKPIVYPGGSPEVTMVKVEVPKGYRTGWHHHPVPCFAYIIEGEFTIETKDGQRRTFKAGEAMAEVVNVAHNGINTGAGTAKLVLFVAGEMGCPFVVREVSSDQ